jgi:hypothetical protein
MEPDEARMRHDLEAANFQVGVDKGRWRLIELRWPHAFIEVFAAPRPNAPAGYVLKMQCDGYPQQLLTAQFWDLRADAQLPIERWPTGADRVQAAFNPGWKRDAIYLPFDRIAFAGHEAWINQHPELLWRPTYDLTFYLRKVYELLSSGEYTGIRG